VTLQDRLEDDLKGALRGGDALRVSTIRLARAALKNQEIERRRPLTEEETEAVLAAEVKRRREAIEAFQRGGRDDLARKESLEMAVLLQYLPTPLSEVEVRRIIGEVVAETGASSPREMGRVMAAVMARVRGRAEGAVVSRLVREALGG